VRLFDADPDLASELANDAAEDATRNAMVPAVDLAVGPWELSELSAASDVRGEVHGFIVIDGMLTVEASLGGRTCVRLLAKRELTLLDGVEMRSLPTAWSWSVLTTARLAILDDRLLVIGRRWPRLMSALLKRAAQSSRQAMLQQAISQFPRVEDRLLALFWTVADRQGTVRPDGVFVSLPVPHRTLANMIGAQRPTVTLGLARLAEQGRLRNVEDGWLIDPQSRIAFRTPTSRRSAPRFSSEPFDLSHPVRQTMAEADRQPAA
jgi:CRP-like cAMP-binding protein